MSFGLKINFNDMFKTASFYPRLKFSLSQLYIKLITFSLSLSLSLSLITSFALSLASAAHYRLKPSSSIAYCHYSSHVHLSSLLFFLRNSLEVSEDGFDAKHSYKVIFFSNSPPSMWIYLMINA